MTFKLLEIEKYEEDKEVFNYLDHIVKGDEISKDLEDFLSGKTPQGFKIGIPILDSHLVFKKNEFYILTGKKGMGKTTINQALQIMTSIVNDLIFVVAFQENSYWSMKLNYMNYLLCDFARDVRVNDPVLYEKANKWIDEHFIFINVDHIKRATEVTKAIIENGTDVHALFLDPINSFKNGWQDTGNGYADGVVSANELLKFSKKYCSVHISQHPTMSGQRQEGVVTSYQGEGGWYLNKASFTYVIHREKGDNNNQIIVENVRNKHTGGGETDKDNPVILEWFPTSVNLRYQTGQEYKNVIAYLVRKHNPLGIDYEEHLDVPEYKVSPENIDNAF